MRNKLLSCLTLLSLLFVADSFGSKPLSERSLEACEKLLSRGQMSQAKITSASTFTPLGTLLGSSKCPYVPVNWRKGDLYSKQFASAGLIQMYRSAQKAADDLIDESNIKAVRPLYDPRDPLAGAAATLDLIRSRKPPEYIRDAVLIREGVVMVVPLLKRVVKRSSKTKLPIYEPILVRGHQELEKFDVLAVAFAGWALEPWLKQIPNKGQIVLRPMIQTKARKDTFESESFTIPIRHYLPQIHTIYKNYMNTVSSSEAMNSIKPRRCSQCAKCPWAAFCRTKMAAAKDLSMMPRPPSAEQMAALDKLGYGTLDRLGRLDINGDRFIDVVVRTGISPERLRYFVAHAQSNARDMVLVTETFEDPFKGKKYLVHIDFEDLMEPGLRSGVYLFGLELEGKSITKTFITSDKLERTSIDDAWAEFLRYFKDHKKLRDGNYAITIYSKHEISKVEQQFDILKQKAEDFTEQERRSEYYSGAVELDADGAGKKLGYLIRRKDFFRKHSDLRPHDVFRIINESVDLLDIVRKNLAFPTYSKGLKHILEYVQTYRNIEYPPGANGLESLAWAKKAFETNEPALMEKIRSYNEIDIDANQAVADYIRRKSGSNVAESLRWGDRFEANKEEIETAVYLKRLVQSVDEKQQVLNQILGRPLSELSAEQWSHLTKVLDRKEFLAETRDLVKNSGMSAKAAKHKLQQMRFEMEAERISNLYKFFRSINPEVDNHQSDAARAMSKLFLLKPQYLTPKHINQILVLEAFNQKMSRIRYAKRKGVWSRLKVPKKLEKSFNSFDFEAIDTEAEVTEADLWKLWRGLYYHRAFPLEE